MTYFRDGHWSDPNTWRDDGNRKRRPRQVWIEKGEAEVRSGEDEFIRDTRQKTSSVFERIEENNASADPVGLGRRDQ